MNRRLALAAAPLVLLAACSSGGGSSDSSSSSSSSTSSSESSDASSEESSTSSETSDAAADETIGQELGRLVSVSSGGEEAYTLSVVSFEQKVAVNYAYPDIIGIKAGEHWSRANVLVCPKQQAQVQWDSFTLVGDDSGSYPAGTTAMDEAFPKPMFPDKGVGIAPGPCRSGWVYFPVTDGVEITDIIFQEPTGASASWKASKP